MIVLIVNSVLFGLMLMLLAFVAAWGKGGVWGILFLTFLLGPVLVVTGFLAYMAENGLVVQ